MDKVHGFTRSNSRVPPGYVTCRLLIKTKGVVSAISTGPAEEGPLTDHVGTSHRIPDYHGRVRGDKLVDGPEEFMKLSSSR